MDWVKIYLLCLIFFQFAIEVFICNSLKEFKLYVASILLYLPMTGRIFGWW